MNKKLLFSCLVFSAITANAQFSSGQRILSGNFTFGTNNQAYSTNSKTNGFNVSMSPSFGKFKDARTINSYGFLVGFNNNKNTSGNIENKTNSNNFGINYTHTKLYPIVDNVYFTLGFGGGLYYNYFKNSNNTNTETSTQNEVAISLGFSPGFMLPISKKVLLQTGFNNLGAFYFSHKKNTNVDALNTTTNTNNTNVYFNAGSTTGSSALFLGFSLML
jgi:hypothetical protein